MDAKERWQALQTHLTRAQERTNAGDRAGALEAVDAALAIDPNFLAAHALRDRILALGSVVAAAPTAAPKPPDAVRPLVSAEGYAQFEQRARRRRVDRRVDAARAALAAGRIKDAVSAIDEIRDLDPNLPELRELSATLAGLGAPRRSHRVGRWLAAAAAFGGVMLAASWLQEYSGLGSRSMVSIAPLVAPPSPLAPLAVSVAAAATDEPVPSPEAIAAATNGELPLSRLTPPESPRPQLSAPAAPAPATQPAVTPAAYAETPPAQFPGLLTPPPTAPAQPQVPAATPAFAPVSLSSVAAAVPPPPLPAPVPTAPTGPTDETLVQQTLQRYRRAYEGLDAQSARAVWPAVNESALARAFDGLQSQTLTFDACDVTMHGEAAAAVCRGTARYVTKIGSHEPRVEPRTWNFTLRKSGTAWSIESARAER